MIQLALWEASAEEPADTFDPTDRVARDHEHLAGRADRDRTPAWPEWKDRDQRHGELGVTSLRIGFLAPISIVTVVAAAVVSVLMEDRPCCTRGLLQATSFVFAECPQFEEQGT